MDNTDEIKKQKAKEYMKNFYEKHPEKITDKIICDICKASYTYRHKCRHLKSNRHKLVVETIKNITNGIHSNKKTDG